LSQAVLIAVPRETHPRRAVPGENLTRVEAQERASHISVESYAVDLDVTQGPTTFRSRTTVSFTARAGSETFIDAITHTVHRITLNGVDVPVAAADGIRISLTNLAATNVLEVDADFSYTNTGEGLHRFVDPVDDEVYLYTQFEVPDSRRVFAVFEQPDLKATFQFTVTAPAAWHVVSNMSTPTPTPGEKGAATWAFAPTPRISSYITALVAGPYVVERSELTSSSGRVIPLGVFCRASLAEYLDADYIFEKTRQGFEFYEDKFDVPYPFEKYDQLFVPEFNAGAMENAGCITFTEAYVFRSKVTNAMRERRVVTILHELAHMWFGDLVTMRWWNDLWLNESFAEYASTLATAEATEWKEAWTTFAAMEKSWAYRQDQLPSTHPIVAEIRDLDDVQVNFDGITYAKGGSVLKQLGAWVGQDQFLAGVSNYFKKHAWGNTELSDLMVELEATSGRDLSEWTKLWLETAGVNTLRTHVTCATDGTIESFAIEQTAPAEWPTIRPHRMAIGFYDLEGGSVKRTHRIELDVDGIRTEVSELVGR
jgi:aminopeptidase N